MQGVHRYTTVYVASLDVKTAFDAAKSEVIAERLKETGKHARMIAALLEEMKDVCEVASVES